MENPWGLLHGDDPGANFPGKNVALLQVSQSMPATGCFD